MIEQEVYTFSASMKNRSIKELVQTHIDRTSPNDLINAINGFKMKLPPSSLPLFEEFFDTVGAQAKGPFFWDQDIDAFLMFFCSMYNSRLEKNGININKELIVDILSSVAVTLAIGCYEYPKFAEHIGIKISFWRRMKNSFGI